MKYKIGKTLVLLCLCLFLFFEFKQPINSTKDFKDVTSTTLQEMNLKTMKKQDALSIKRFLSLDPKAYEDMVYYKDTDVYDATEIVIVKFKDNMQKETFEKAIDQRVKNQRNVFDGYLEDQAQLVKDYIIDIQANYAIYVVAKNASAIDKAFQKAL